MHSLKTAQAAIEVLKLREATNAQKDFYRLQIDELALEDIKELKEVMKKLNQPEVLGKIDLESLLRKKHILIYAVDYLLNLYGYLHDYKSKK